ncbi:MAG: cobyrinate a,c-diamide synthase [Thermodesulfovibrionales bacterium]|nr:cobyrinate a,c-diamide synthase [Thermodesulfovibrionales bacterium]
MRGVIIAGTHSGCGKTTVTLGIMAALKAMGLKVQPFKCGPDFIDAGIHRLITEQPSRNLDIWMCGEDYVKKCFYKHSIKADISVIEGVMGIYDGRYSTASLAKILNLPVILVVDAYGMAESAGALIKGYRDWADEKGVNLRWIIFNRVGSERHYMRLKNSIRDVQIIGYLPRSLNFKIPQRHLGLMVAEETPIQRDDINRLSEAILKNIELKTLISESLIKANIYDNPPTQAALEEANCQPQFKRVAVAYDKSFCFYYEDNLDTLRNAYAEIVKFSPLTDSRLPLSIDAVYLGGGYPELYAKELSENKSMLKDIKEWSLSGMPLYAECGGLMYLSKGIYDQDGIFFEMAGVFPFETSISLNKRAFLGYREATLKEDSLLGYRGETLRGHEFHYSEINNLINFSDLKRLYLVKDGEGLALDDEGYSYKNTLASYIHLHFGSSPNLAYNLINFTRSD